MRKISLPGFFLLFIVLTLFIRCKPHSSGLEMPVIFSDHMVLQRDAQVPIWGTATPGAQVDLVVSWEKSASTKANADGKWQMDISTPGAGGPFEIQVIAADTTIQIKDVLIGEVWLGSGQSNMEMPLKGWPPNDPIEQSAKEIEMAQYPQIRMFTVQKRIEDRPVRDMLGSWAVCNPEQAADFSATAYFFGRTLHETINVPIGLIHSSWGGTPAESWTEGKHLAELTNYTDVLRKIDQLKPLHDSLNQWLSQKTTLEISDLFEDGQWTDPGLKDDNLVAATTVADNPQMNLPQTWEQDALRGFDGVVVFQRMVEIPADLAGMNLKLELGAIDDMDQTYFNGQLVGQNMKSGFWNKERNYKIPADLVKQGENILTVSVFDTGGGGGFTSNPDKMRIIATDKIAETIPLAGSWSYLPLAEINNGKIYLYEGTLADYKSRPKVDMTYNSHTPTVLYNAMIHPLVPYKIKGAIWYQGESNVQRAAEYETLFPKMIESWRSQWGQGDFPFYFVQIAPYNYGNPEGIASAQLRDAQRKSLRVANTGMVVTLDIGNVNNIHPGNKQEVGSRLAKWALAKDYGKSDTVFSGPLFKDVRIEKGQAIVSFDFTANGLVGKSEPLLGFEIAGEGAAYLKANAIIKGNEVIVSHPDVKVPERVRYAFTNGSEGSLFNTAGLPASSFSME